MAERKNESVDVIKSSPKPSVAKEFGVIVTGVVLELKREGNQAFFVITEIKGGVVSKLDIPVEDIQLYDSSGRRYIGVETVSHLKKSIGHRLRFYESGSFYGFPNGFWKGDGFVRYKRKFGLCPAYVFSVSNPPTISDTIPTPKGSPPRFEFEQGSRDEQGKETKKEDSKKRPAKQKQRLQEPLIC